MAESVGTQTGTENATGTTSQTITIDATDSTTQQEETVQLKLRKPHLDRKVQWSNETVDNEHMDKKKSKCCCIYKKPLAFGESSSDESSGDETCDHHSHKKSKQPKNPEPDGDHQEIDLNKDVTT